MVFAVDRKNIVASWLGIPAAVVIDLYAVSLDATNMEPLLIPAIDISQRVPIAAV